MAKTAKRYKVLIEVDYPTDPKVIARLLAGEVVPAEEQLRVSHAVGELVSDVPACSVPWLLEAGAIEEVGA